MQKAIHLSLHPLVQRIAEGEGLQLDFKKTITSAQKIAATLAAFANTKGGTLLIGVRDNGTITSCNPEEEIYMIDSAARVFCRPEVPFEYAEIEYKDLAVLQVTIAEGPHKPYQAKNEEGQWRSYIRVHDKSLLASPIVNAVMLRQARGRGTLIHYTPTEKAVLQYLQAHGKADFDQIARAAQLPKKRAQVLLVNLVSAGLVRVVTLERAEFYTLAG
jgi:hypothetical protein